MFGTKLNIPASVAGKTVDLSIKHGKETDKHIVMWVGVKTDKATGEMKGQLRGVRNDSTIKQILNFLKGRRLPSADELRMHCKNRGLSDRQAETVLINAKKTDGAYQVESFNQQIADFEIKKREIVQKSNYSPEQIVTVRMGITATDQ